MAIEAFFTFFQYTVRAFPETTGALRSLRARGLPIGILTDVPYGMPLDFVQRDLAASGIAGLYDALLTSVEVGVRKPEPAGYLALAGRLGVVPQEMLYVGNEPKDVIGAARAGATGVFLDRTHTCGNHGQHFTIYNLTGVGDIVLGTVTPRNPPALHENPRTDR